MDQFILFGDSITQRSFSQERGFGFGAALSDAYVRKLDVVNRGYSGFNTRQALHILPQVLPLSAAGSAGHGHVRFMSIFFGANDARLPDTPGGPDQHIPLAEFEANLEAMVAYARTNSPATRLILITPPPVDERKCLEADQEAQPRCDPSTAVKRPAEVTAQYAKAVRDVGRREGVDVLDLWTAMQVEANAERKSTDGDAVVGSLASPANWRLQSFLHDGLHLSPAGYKLLYAELVALIERVWPDQAPGRLRLRIPAWDDVEAWKE